MTDCLCVKGFNEITYDELMDVVGGGSITTYADVDSDGKWEAGVTYTFNNGSSVGAFVGSRRGAGVYYRSNSASC